ncbi:MAG TPA: hypothetical protein PKA20_19120 [Burkholderiaceae bacterium]|nr:hypothetical protein [Burkholderiaceae bacterium]
MAGALCGTWLSPAAAHDPPKPRYGGVVQQAEDIDFELVTVGDDSVIYLFDHGKPKPAGGISGKLAVVDGGPKQEIELTFAGSNKLQAKGFRAPPRAKLAAQLHNVGGKSITVRFQTK